MKIIVGLGNPGKRYAGTRHNIGFEVLAELGRRFAVGSRPKSKFDGEIIETTIDQQPVCLACPLTFMNQSGRCVQPLVDFYKIAMADLLVVCDDFNLPLAKLRLRPDGSPGGQNGLADILERLGTQQVPRLRIGIGPVPPQWDPADFVLSRFDAQQRPAIDDAIRRGADAVRVWLSDGMDRAMSRFNRDPSERPEEPEVPPV
jgi:PTH1 family peptidyl-tRNA hydrolase